MKTWISGFLVGVCMMFWVIILVGCMTPKTPEGWATLCIEKGESSREEFDKCVKQWDDWARRELNR